MNCLRTRTRYVYVDNKTQYLAVGVRTLAECQCEIPNLIPINTIFLHITRTGAENPTELIYPATSRSTITGSILFRVDSQLLALTPGIYDATVKVNGQEARNVMNIVIRNTYVADGMYSNRIQG